MVTLPNGTVLEEVTRQSCLDRLYAIPLGTIPYSNSVISPVTGRRADCTGLVSEVWGTPEQGEGIWLRAYSTASFYGEQVIRRIGWSELLPGDSIGYYVPTVGDPTPRHAAIWLGGDRQPNGQYHIRDHGSGMGPKDRWVGAPWTGWLHPDRLAPWRYVAMEEEFMSALSDDDQTAMKWRIEAIPSLRNPINLHVKDSAGKERTEPNVLAEKLIDMEAAIDALAAAGAGGGLTENQVRAIVREELDKTDLVGKLGVAE